MTTTAVQLADNEPAFVCARNCGSPGARENRGGSQDTPPVPWVQSRSASSVENFNGTLKADVTISVP